MKALRSGTPKGSIAYKIASALYLQKNFGEALLQDKMLQNLLLQLDQNIEATWEEMASVGVMRECTDCAVNSGRNAGGHLLECRIQNAKAEIDYTAELHMALPKPYKTDVTKEGQKDKGN
jgi:hypothetical protein